MTWFFRTATSRKNQSRVWYTRVRKKGTAGINTRKYHVISLGRNVSANKGSFWELIIFRWAFIFNYRE